MERFPTLKSINHTVTTLCHKMILRVWTVCCLWLAGLSLCFAETTAPASGEPAAEAWRQLTRTDLAFVRQLVLQNHPGSVDDQNPDFAAHLESNYAAACQVADHAGSFEGWLFSLRFYVASFQDGHFEFGESLNHEKVRWPGFFATYAGDGKYQVSAPEPGEADELPPAGAELLSCDGHPIPELMAADVLPYCGIRTLEASCYRYALRLLLDEGNPAHPVYTTCRVKVGDQEKDYALRWRAIASADLAARRRPVSRGARVKSSLETTADGGAWLRLSDFNPSPEDARALHALFARLAEVRAAPYVVFDLRGNDGGSSDWGEEVIKNFFGPQTLARLQLRDHSSVDWRVSPGNLAYLRDLLPKIERNFGKESIPFTLVSRIVLEMDEAQAHGQPFYHEPAEHPQEVSGANQGAGISREPPSYRGKVFLLTDAWDASAALDFCDLLLGVDGVVQIGQPTYADSVYLEARWPLALPSGLGNIGLPIKVYRDRTRGNNQPYVPTYRWRGNITDTAGLKTWVMDLMHEAASSPAREQKN